MPYQSGVDRPEGDNSNEKRKGFVSEVQKPSSRTPSTKIFGVPLGAVAHPVVLSRHISWWFVFASGTSLSCILLGVLVAEIEHFGETSGANYVFLEEVLKILIVIISGASLLGFMEYYDGRVQLAKARGVYIAQEASFWNRLRRAGFLKGFIIDCIIHFVIPFPFLHVKFEVWDEVLKQHSTYSLSILLVLAMFSRLIYLPRLICTCHHLNSEDARAYGRMIAVDVSTTMIAKVLLNESFSFLAGLWFVCIFVFSYIMFTFERDYALAHNIENETLQSFNNCIWLTAVTMTTIGYGDLYPVTRFGRMCAVASCFVAVALFALTLNLVLAFLAVDHDEESFIRTTRYHLARRRLKQAAAQVVEAVYLRSPMYERLKQRADFKGYQAIVMMETAADCRQPAQMGGARKFGRSRLSGEELGSLRAALDDGRVMDKLRRFRQLREEVEHRRSVREADETLQVATLAEIHRRTEQHVDALRNVLQELNALSLPPQSNKDC